MEDAAAREMKPKSIIDTLDLLGAHLWTRREVDRTVSPRKRGHI